MVIRTILIGLRGKFSGPANIEVYYNTPKNMLEQLETLNPVALKSKEVKGLLKN